MVAAALLVLRQISPEVWNPRRLSPWISAIVVLLCVFLAFHCLERRVTVEPLRKELSKVGELGCTLNGEPCPPGTLSDILKYASSPRPGLPCPPNGCRSYQLRLYDRTQFELRQIDRDSDKFRLYMPGRFTGRSIEIGRFVATPGLRSTLSDLR